MKERPTDNKEKERFLLLEQTLCNFLGREAAEFYLPIFANLAERVTGGWRFRIDPEKENPQTIGNKRRNSLKLVRNFL